ncbi:hypothetical protein MRB53_038907 [Persea americana]|nr:hypothetical protein MRB53_038907 [Persea americana]
MVFDYVMPMPTSEDTPTFSYGSSRDSAYYTHSAPRDIPRTSRSNGFVAPSDLYSPAIAPPQRYSGRENYENNPRSSSTAYITPPGDYPRNSQVYTDRSSEERASPPKFEIKTISPTTSKRYYCEVPNCKDQYGKQSSAGRKADLKRHMGSVHGKPFIDCEYPKCPRKGEDGFCRDDHYKEHLRGYHGKPIPKADRTKRSP